MAYDPPSFLTVRTAVLDGYRNQISGADVSEDSEIYARASAWSMGVALVAQGLLYVEDQIFVSSCDGPSLDRWANEYGLAGRHDPVEASGFVALTGTSGTVVDAGLVMVSDAGVEYTTQEPAVLPATVLVVANTAGAAGNLTEGDVLTIQSPPTDVDGTATVDEDGISGGADQESDAALRARVLARRRAGSAGGTAADYQTWALEVAGVMEAHVLPLRRGLGSVDVAIFVEGVGGVRTPAGSTILSNVQTALDAARPVTADVQALAATEQGVTVTIHLQIVKAGYLEADVMEAIEAAVEAFFAGLETGETGYLVQLSAAIANVAGVAQFGLLAPDEDVVPDLDETHAEILVPATITIHETTWEAPL